MLDVLWSEPGAIRQLARQLAELQANLHRQSMRDELPAQRTLLAHKITRCTVLSETERDAVLNALSRLPDARWLCHGDFHPGNVILTARGPMIIDWTDASSGNPVADVARTSLICLGYLEHLPAENVVNAVRLFHQTYVDAYFSKVPERRAEYENWLPVMAAARLTEGIKDQLGWLLNQVRTGLS